MEGDELHAEGIASYSADVTWRYRRRFFCWGVAQMGGRRCCGICLWSLRWLVASVAVSFPLHRRGMMAGAPAATGTRGAASVPAVAGGVGGSVFLLSRRG